jgi:outer membrane protein
MPRITLLTLLTVLLAFSQATADILTLQQCLHKASTANRQLKVAAHDVKIAEQNITIGRSGYLPRLDLNGGYTVQQNPQSVLIQSFAVPTQDSNFAFTSASLHQTIYDFGRTPGRYGQAKALSEATSYNYTATEKDIFLQVVEAYYGVLESKKLLQSAEEEVAQMTDHVNVSQNLFDQGVVTRNDLLQAEVQLANSNQRRLAAFNRVENSWILLDYLIGIEPSYRAELQDGQNLEQIPPSVNIETVMTNRPEWKSLKKSIQAGEFAVEESRSEYFPEIYAKLGVDYVENTKVVEQAILYATVGFQINLFDGFATTARHRQTVEALSRDKESLRDLDARIRVEYETASNDAHVAAERINAVKKSIQQGEENLRINKDRYQEQVGTATDVIDAQTLLTQTRTEYYTAIFDYQVAVARVKKAMGEL